MKAEHAFSLVNALDLENASNALHDIAFVRHVVRDVPLTQVHHDVCESRGVGCTNSNITWPEPRFVYGEFSPAWGRAAVIPIQLQRSLIL